MNIEVDNFIMRLSEQEFFTIVFAIRDKLLQSAEHCAMHDGMETFFYNYKMEAEMLKQMVTRLDRCFIYDDCMSNLEKKIKDLQAE